MTGRNEELVIENENTDTACGVSEDVLGRAKASSRGDQRLQPIDPDPLAESPTARMGNRNGYRG